MNESKILSLKMFSNSESIVCVKGNAYDSLMPHAHDFYELSCVISGKGVHRLDNVTYSLKTNDIFFIVNGSTHSIDPLEGEESFQLININFKKEVVEELGYSFPLNIVLNGEPYFAMLFKRAYMEYENKETGYKKIIHSILVQILEYVLRLSNRKTGIVSEANTKKNLTSTEIIDAVRGYIAENYWKPIKVEDIAHDMGIGLSSLQKMFRNEKNTTVKNTLIEYRIKIACKLLLETQMPVQSISEKVGFNDLKNFYYTFKSLTGATPRSFRNRNKKNVNMGENE